jgi:hypothetical protein
VIRRHIPRVPFRQRNRRLTVVLRQLMFRIVNEGSRHPVQHLGHAVPVSIVRVRRGRSVRIRLRYHPIFCTITGRPHRRHARHHVCGRTSPGPCANRRLQKESSRDGCIFCRAWQMEQLHDASLPARLAGPGSTLHRGHSRALTPFPNLLRAVVLPPKAAPAAPRNPRLALRCAFAKI